MTERITQALTVLLLTVLVSVPAVAGWPDDPAANMVICDRSDRQSATKIAATSDGGCYISWYDEASGNYDVYLQRLSGSGVPQWANNGLLISNHPQESWVSDYDLACDQDDHAILVINDIRDGSDHDIFAYRISPAGDFVWGADGLTISANDGYEPDPRVIVTSDGNLVFGWPEDDTLHLRKLTPAGVDVWNPATLTLTSTYGYSVPRLAPTDNDGVILQALLHTGSPVYDPKHLTVFKLDAGGNHLWSPAGETVSDAGGFAQDMRPDLIADGAGGAYCYWYDTRNSSRAAFVQHVTSAGVMAWTANGVTCSTVANQNQGVPSVTRVPNSDDILVFFPFSDAYLTRSGVRGQRLNPAGQRLWTDNGVILDPLEFQNRWGVRALAQPDGAIVTYLDDVAELSTKVMAIRMDMNANQVWSVSPVEMTTNSSTKGLMGTCINSSGQVINAWSDRRADSSGDIYLQNINPDGSLGPLSPLPGGPRLIVGPGPGYDNPPVVRVFPPDQGADHLFEFDAYGPDHYGVGVCAGDVDGDGLSDLLTGAGPGDIYGPHVRGFELDGTAIPGLSFLAYGTNKWGVNVTCGDIDGDGFDEIITGAGPGAVFGPHVRGWDFDGSGSATPVSGVSYFAYGTPKWGVNVAAGDIDGDGYDEIVTGAGPGAVYGPHVRGWNVDGGTAAAIPTVSFLAYGTNKWGVNVTCGDVDGDGIDEIITTPGPSEYFGPHVRGWNVDGGSVEEVYGLSFFAWDPEFGGHGATVCSGADLDGDGLDEFIVASGPDPHMDTSVLAYQYNGAGVTMQFNLTAFDNEMSYGANVAAGRF